VSIDFFNKGFGGFARPHYAVREPSRMHTHWRVVMATC
jgi:hypothetical protein